MALLSFLGRVACLRILIVARVLGARLRFCVSMWCVCTFLLELLAGVRASSLVEPLGAWVRVCCVIGNWECGLLWLVFMWV